MEEQNIIRIEDQIKYAFENFEKYSQTEQNHLVQLVTQKFKIEQMPHPIRKPVTVGLAEYSLKYNTLKPGLQGAFKTAGRGIVNEIEIYFLVLGLLNDSAFTTYIKENKTDSDIKVLRAFAKKQIYSSSSTLSNCWQVNIASLDVEIAQHVVDQFAELMKEEVQYTKTQYGGDYRLNAINSRLIDICKIVGIKNLRMGKVVLALKEKHTQLDRLAAEVPDAAKYVNLL